MAENLYPAGSAVFPNSPQANTAGRNHTKTFVIIVFSLVVLTAVGGVVYFMPRSRPQSQSTNTVPSTNSDKELPIQTTDLHQAAKENPTTDVLFSGTLVSVKGLVTDTADPNAYDIEIQSFSEVRKSNDLRKFHLSGEEVKTTPVTIVSGGQKQPAALTDLKVGDNIEFLNSRSASGSGIAIRITR